MPGERGGSRKKSRQSANPDGPSEALMRAVYAALRRRSISGIRIGSGSVMVRSGMEPNCNGGFQHRRRSAAAAVALSGSVEAGGCVDAEHA
jgi:hypothetical protein